MKLEAPTFAVHTRDGQTLGAIEGGTDFTWSRELNEVSRLNLTAGYQTMAARIVPWKHWITCYHGQTLQWTGPIVEPVRSEKALTIDARDVSRLMWFTRTKVTKSWDHARLGDVAAEMLNAMLAHHRIGNARPQVLAAVPGSGPYSVVAKADIGYVHQDMAELSKLGLRWTVHRGRPVLGSHPMRVAAELEARHLAAGVQIRRSGAQFANDVRLQGKNFSHTVYVPVDDLRLESIVSLDDTAGVANITKAAEEYAARSGVIRDELVVPSSSTLSPDAPVELTDLICGMHVSVAALGIRSVLRMDKVEVSGNGAGTAVTVSLSTPENPTELEKAGGTVVT